MSKSPADDVVSIYRAHADAFVRLRGTGLIGEFRRLAAPGAVLMFTSGPALGEAIGEFEGKPLYHGSLDGGEYRGLLAANGFEVVRLPPYR
ncbi:hypothetical protein D3C87_157050 [compost metagenome]|uniref:hypothetical protein n=1 Tax=Achromobacter sp. Root83 TaxID=1736602 RepID=UPI00070FB3E6|nr:hypothetical protein [Achromobacter sp. Root83]KRC71672.1 hypothetical protein ASE30_12975 [Achromobacter sp. Root83]